MAEKLTLQQKLLQIRQAMPKIEKERHSPEVKYRFARLDDIWQALRTLMDQNEVNFHIIEEKNVEVEQTSVQTRYGERLMFIYQADLTVVWTNADDPDDHQKTHIHVIGWNDDPAKAKGAAWTYALKYYLFNTFCVNSNADDPDSQNYQQNYQQEESRGTHYAPPEKPQKPQQHKPNTATLTTNNNTSSKPSAKTSKKTLNVINVILGGKGGPWETTHGTKFFRSAMKPNNEICWLLGWTESAAKILAETPGKSRAVVTVFGEMVPADLTKEPNAPKLPPEVAETNKEILMVSEVSKIQADSDAKNVVPFGQKEGGQATYAQ